MKFRHDKPITRFDGVWQGKDVDDVEVKDPRLDIEKSLREKGTGSKKSAYKGLYQVEPYEVSSAREVFLVWQSRRVLINAFSDVSVGREFAVPETTTPPRWNLYLEYPPTCHHLSDRTRHFDSRKNKKY